MNPIVFVWHAVAAVILFLILVIMIAVVIGLHFPRWRIALYERPATRCERRTAKRAARRLARKFHPRSDAPGS